MKEKPTIEPLDAPQTNRYSEIMAVIRQEQQARNHVPPTAAEVDRYLREERDSWR